MGVSAERLSRLQKWVLKTTLEKGFEPSAGDDFEKYIPRKHLIRHWLNENCKSKRMVDYCNWLKESATIRPKFNVSLTRSIKNLREKGFIRIFRIDTPDLIIWAFRDAARQAVLSRGMSRLAGADTTEEDKIINTYQAAKEARKVGGFRLTEIKVDDEFKHSVQAIALTDKGRQSALMLTSHGCGEINNKGGSP